MQLSAKRLQEIFPDFGLLHFSTCIRAKEMQRIEFLCSTRTMHLYNQLQTSDLSIPMLMEENGMTNYKTFIRTFKEIYGATPQKVRQETA